MKYTFSTYRFPQTPSASTGLQEVPCLELSEHFVATPPLWACVTTPKETLLRECPRITHKPSGLLVLSCSCGTLRTARYVAKILEALPQNWDHPEWELFPEWAKKYMLAWKRSM